MQFKKMSNTYTWNINSKLFYPKANGLTDVVHTIIYSYTAESDITGSDTTNLTSSVYGSQNIAFPSASNFTPFNEVSDELVVNWLTGSLDIGELNSDLDTKINMLTGSGVNTQD